MVGSTPHLLPGMPVWVHNEGDNWLRAVLVKPVGSTEPGHWFARLAEDPLNRRNVKCHVDQLLARSEDEDEAMSGNLTALREVSEPEVMSALSRRFSLDQPFTYAGPVLVSMKPNVDLSLYSAKEQQKYNYAIAGKQGVEPHLFTVGGRAYREMVKNQLSQTVLLTGSAGSGKSEACRQLVRQLIHGCHTDSRDSTEGGKCDTAVMLQQLEAAQEMLRLMGSVAIDDSPDSSRYSVVIKGQFDSEPHLVGIGVKAELMDKSPLSLGHEGNSFHMLHLLAYHAFTKEGAPLYKFLHIDEGATFRYLGPNTMLDKMGGSVEPVTGTLKDHGTNNWETVMKCFDLLEVTRNETSFFLQLLAAVLHLGNLDFTNEGVMTRTGHQEMSRAIPSDLGLFKLICQLLWLEEELVLEALVGKGPDVDDNRKEARPGQKLEGKLPSVAQARNNADLLAQTVYQVAFDWVVATTNNLQSHVESNVALHLNFLDVPGLINEGTYGALCSNLMVEMVQQRVWRHFLGGPASKLQAEGIDFAIKRPAADGVLEVIVGGQYPGVLSIVSEIHSMTKETLGMLLDRMSKAEPSKSVLSHVDADGSGFSVVHSEREVHYDSNLVLAVCGGLFGLDIGVVLQQSGNRILRGGAAMLPHGGENSPPPNAFSNFKNAADSILNTINPYSTHVVQTLKPSHVPIMGQRSDGGPDAHQCDHALVVAQVRGSILPELLHWERNGFTEWIPHGQFVREYRYLLSEDDLQTLPLKELCNKVLTATLPPDAYAVGDRHILLKGDKTRALAAHLAARKEAAAVAIQARARGVIGRIRFRRLWRIKNTAANDLKRVMRGFKQREDYELMRIKTIEAQQLLARVMRGHLSRIETINHKPSKYFCQAYMSWNKGLTIWEKAYHAALTFKKLYRGHSVRKWYWGYTDRDGREMIGYREWKLSGYIVIQKYFRGYLGRRRASAMATRVYAACVIQESYIKHLVRQNAYCTRIQRWWRAIMAERAFGWVHMKLSDAALKVQRVFRGHKGRDLAAKCGVVNTCWDLWLAATKIQRWFKPILDEIRKKRRGVAATKIQRAWRSAVARAAWLWVHCQLNDSATSITKAFRGFRSRKKTLALKASMGNQSYLDGPNTARSGALTNRSEQSDFQDWQSQPGTDRPSNAGMAPAARPRKPKFSLSKPSAPNIGESKGLERRKAGADPFTPMINEKSAALRRTGRVEDRLEQAHRAHLERMEAQRRAKLEKDLEQNSQGPKMNKKSKKICKSYGSVAERFPMYQKQKEANLEQARKEQGEVEEETLTFHPKITKPAQAMERTPAVWEQWYKDKYKRLKELERAVRAQEAQDIRDPQISKGTARIAARRKDADKPVYDRLYAYQGKYRDNRENLIREEEQRFDAEQTKTRPSRSRPAKRVIHEDDSGRASELFSSLGMPSSAIQHPYTPTVNPRSTEIMRAKQERALQMLDASSHAPQPSVSRADGSRIGPNLTQSQVTDKAHERSLDQWNSMLSSFKEDFDR